MVDVMGSAILRTAPNGTEGAELHSERTFLAEDCYNPLSAWIPKPKRWHNGPIFIDYGS